MKIFTSSLMALALLGGAPAVAHDPQGHGASAEMTAHAEAVQFGDLEIEGAFTRATLPNAPVAGGYLTITNNGDIDDRLVAGSASFAGRVEIHQMAVVNDVMNMRQLPDGLPIPAGETVTLEPGGLHLMFMQLQEPLVEGTPVTVTLEFENAGMIEVELAVGGIGARTAPGNGHDHGGH